MIFKKNNILFKYTHLGYTKQKAIFQIPRQIQCTSFILIVINKLF